jgi:hypothetical protein
MKHDKRRILKSYIWEIKERKSTNLMTLKIIAKLGITAVVTKPGAMVLRG